MAPSRSHLTLRDLCKILPFAQFRCQAQILILEILYVFLWVKFSPSLNLNKIERFSKVSLLIPGYRFSIVVMERACFLKDGDCQFYRFQPWAVIGKKPTFSQMIFIAVETYLTKHYPFPLKAVLGNYYKFHQGTASMLSARCRGARHRQIIKSRRATCG